MLKPLARILGPKGLMPNTKSGTLVKPDELINAVKLSKQGQIEFRINDHSDIMVKIGLREFEDEKLFENFDSFVLALLNKKPESIKSKKGALINYRQILHQRVHEDNNGISIEARPESLPKDDRVKYLSDYLP